MWALNPITGVLIEGDSETPGAKSWMMEPEIGVMCLLAKEH